jgi:hypothetical protein
MEIGPKPLDLRELTLDGFGFLYAKRTQFRVAELGVGYGKWQMANGEWHMVVELFEVKSGGCHEGESSAPMPESGLGRVVEQDFHRVIENSTNDKIWNLVPRGERTRQTDRARATASGRASPAAWTCQKKRQTKPI